MIVFFALVRAALFPAERTYRIPPQIIIITAITPIMKNIIFTTSLAMSPAERVSCWPVESAPCLIKSAALFA